MSEWEGVRHTIELLEKLDQYQKTGLSPEEVEHLKLASMGKADTEIRMFDDGRMERLSDLATIHTSRPLRRGIRAWEVLSNGLYLRILLRSVRNNKDDIQWTCCES